MLLPQISSKLFCADAVNFPMKLICLLRICRRPIINFARSTVHRRLGSVCVFAPSQPVLCRTDRGKATQEWAESKRIPGGSGCGRRILKKPRCNMLDHITIQKARAGKPVQWEKAEIISKALGYQVQELFQNSKMTCRCLPKPVGL